MNQAGLWRTARAGGRCDNGRHATVWATFAAPVLSGAVASTRLKLLRWWQRCLQLDVSGVPDAWWWLRGRWMFRRKQVTIGPIRTAHSSGRRVPVWRDQVLRSFAMPSAGRWSERGAPALECLALGDSCTLDSSPNCCGGTSCTPTGCLGTMRVPCPRLMPASPDGGAFDGSRSGSGPPDAGPTDASGLDATAVDAAAQDAGACVANTGTCTTAGECCRDFALLRFVARARASLNSGACTARRLLQGLSCSVPPGATHWDLRRWCDLRGLDGRAARSNGIVTDPLCIASPKADWFVTARRLVFAFLYLIDAREAIIVVGGGATSGFLQRGLRQRTRRRPPFAPGGARC